MAAALGWTAEAGGWAEFMISWLLELEVKDSVEAELEVLEGGVFLKLRGAATGGTCPPFLGGGALCWDGGGGGGA